MSLLLVTLNNPHRRRSTQGEGKRQTVIPQTPLFSAVLTSPLHLGSASSQAALSDSTSAPAVHDQLATELEAPSTSGIAGPSQPVPSGSSTSATVFVDDTLTAGHDASQFPSTSSSAAGPIHSTFDLSALASTGEFAMVDDTLATGYQESELLSTLSSPSQPTFDFNAGTSLGEFTTVDDILTAGDDGLRFLSALLGPTDPSQPFFDGVGTSASDITMVDNTWVPGYEASQSSATFLGPSQHTFDLNPSGFGGELPMVEDTSAAGYEMLQFLNTSLGPAGPSQPSFDFGAGTGGNEFITVDNAWVPGYEASGLSQPALDLDASAFVGEYPPVEEMLEFLSNFLGSADPSQPVFDVGASTSAIEPTMVDNAWVTGNEAPQHLSTPSFDFNAGASVGDFEMVDETVAAGHEMTEFLSTLSGPGDPSQPFFDLGVATDKLADNQLTAELETLLFPSAPSGSTNRSMPVKNGSRRRRRPNSSLRQTLTSRPMPTTASFSSGSESQPSFNPSFPGDRAIDASDASAAGSYSFSFKFSGSQPSTSVPGTIGSTSTFFNNAGTSNDFGGAMIGANQQAEAIPSTQMSRPRMDARTREDSVPVLGTDAGSSAVDTMLPSSSSLFNALG